MKILLASKILFYIAILIMPFFGLGQTNKDVIEQVQKLMLKYYVFLDKADETNAHLEKLMKKKHFQSFTEPADFAKELTAQMRKITKDKHLTISSPRQKEIDKDPVGTFIKRLPRYYTPMFNEFKYVEKNIGYVDMRYFGGGEKNIAKIDVVMKQLSQADALIFDMRKNGGGSPTTVAYLCSYFFDKKFLLNKIYNRAEDHTRELWTVEVNGKKRPDVPVYILTSKRTFSGAEDFSYTMQSFKRATVIGEVTGGGAHPTRGYPLANGFSIGIPFAMSINPVTNTNWEGTGVAPDIKIDADKAFEKAKSLAIKSAKEYKDSFFYPMKKALSALENQQKISEVEEDELHRIIEKIVSAELISEDDVNTLGYNYFLSKKNAIALCIFKSNTLLFPNSANTFDSYAEALAANNQKELALENYKKAVALAKAQNHEYLSYFEDNLKTFEKNMNN